MALITDYGAALSSDWTEGTGSTGTGLLEPDRLGSDGAWWSENIAVCDVDDDLDDDEAYFLDDEEDDDDDFSDDYDDDDYEDDDFDTDSDDDYDDDDL
jgi:hypothetical protein